MFTSNTQAQIKEMLAAIGAGEIKDLFKEIPSDVLYPAFNLPAALDEGQLLKEMAALAEKNKKVLNFCGGGIYEHFIPSAVNALSSRGEFLSAYTPYQAEASQGTLQAIYEYQSAICALYNMDVSNASHYDGATALAEAALACARITNKNKILIPASLHPHYKDVLLTYLEDLPLQIDEVKRDQNGRLDMADLQTKPLADYAALVLATPNYFGVIEDADAVSKFAKEAGLMLIAVANPLTLGVLKTPGEYGADFAVGEGQPLGNAMNFGGPTLGIFTCKKEHVRHMPGRIVGVAKDKAGARAFVLTLQAREQHIRRERAASNICSNQALCALNAVIYMTLLGPEGMREVACLNLARAAELKDKITALKGFKLKFNAPFFNEFVVECEENAHAIVKRLAEKNIAAGVALDDNSLLLCATETKTSDEIDAFARALEGK